MKTCMRGPDQWPRLPVPGTQTSWVNGKNFWTMLESWELNQILTPGSKLIFFGRHLIRDSQGQNPISSSESWIFTTRSNSRIQSLLIFTLFIHGGFFIFLKCLESYSPSRDYENFLPMKKIIIGSQDPPDWEGSQWFLSPTSCLKPGLCWSQMKLLRALFNRTWKCPRIEPAQPFWSICITAWLSS